jgi:hydroxymethylpyrimidine pyrophosphatase-like HAD family hydrolase
MKLNSVIFIDLDDTLFQSLAKLSTDNTLEPVANYKSGAPCSYNTEKQRALFKLLDSNMTLIPTTARDIDAFRRVNLSFKSYVICNFGGVVLTPSGEVDRRWFDNVQHRICSHIPRLLELHQIITEYCSLNAIPSKSKIIEDLGQSFYLNVKDPEKNLERIDIIQRTVVEPWLNKFSEYFFVHRNANNLAVVPNPIDKSEAVKYVTTLLKLEHEELLTFGMGDSNSDSAFMLACDYSLIPNNSQLSKLLESTK